MQVFENREFRSGEFADRDSGGVFQGFKFVNCYFQGAFVSIANSPECRSTIRDVELINCSQRGCTVYNPILENVVMDGLDTNGQVLRCHGAVYRHVVLQGKIDSMLIANDVLPSPLSKREIWDRQIALFHVANAEYYRNVDWALDISRGEFKELDLRGIPARLVRRDPETQFVVRRQSVLSGEWQGLGLAHRLWATSFDLLARREDHEKVFVAPKRHRDFRSLLSDLQLLRRAGIAEPE